MAPTYSTKRRHTMRGHIVKRSKNSYFIAVSLGKDATGKYKQHWVIVKGTKKDAEKRPFRDSKPD